GPGQRVYGDDDRDQHEADADRQRQVALGSLQRNRRRHGAGEAFDIAADDDDGADLRRGTAKAGEQRRDQAEARVPDQRADAANGPEIHRGEFVAVFDPEILDGLSGQRGDDRRDQHGLRDDHGARREQQAERAQRPGARQRQIDRETDDDRRQAHQGAEQDDDALAAG